MKNKKKVSAMYRNLLKKYFYLFINERSRKIPGNCTFNLQHPLDIRKYINGQDGEEPNPNYNKINQKVHLWYDAVLRNDKEKVLFLINDEQIYLPAKLIKGELSDGPGLLGIELSDAITYGLEDYFEYIGLCELTIDKDIKLCERSEDAEKCPAFIIKYSKSEIESMFWAYAETHHNDLMVLKEILGDKGKIPFWCRVKTFFSFKNNENSK